jgi:hypothetical protein
MITIVLKIKAGARVCGDNDGICHFRQYRGGRAGKREFSCSLFSEMLEVNIKDRFYRTKRLSSCLEVENDQGKYV